MRKGGLSVISGILAVLMVFMSVDIGAFAKSNINGGNVFENDMLVADDAIETEEIETVTELGGEEPEYEIDDAGKEWIKKPVTVETVCADGSIGSVVWSIDKNGKLSIEGIGDIERNDFETPWMDYPHGGMVKEAKINLSNFRDASFLLAYLHNLNKVDLSELDTSEVTDMKFMFYDCPSLTSLDLNNFDTSKVTNMMQMFDVCENLKSLDIRSFNTAKVTVMYSMFGGCSSLESLDIRSFDTCNVDEMSWMFWDCKSLTSLDLSNFDMKNASGYDMIEGCDKLKTIYSPQNVNVDIELPPGNWYLPDGSTITCLPKNHKESICITKYKPNSNSSNDFNEYLYRADYLHDLSVPSSKIWHNDVSAVYPVISPSINYYNALCESGMTWTASAWDIINNTLDAIDNPSKVATSIITHNQDMYEAVLLEIFGSEDNNIIKDGISALSNCTKMQKSVIGVAKDAMMGVGIAQNANWNSLSVEKQTKFIETLKDDFKNNPDTKLIYKEEKIISCVSDIMSCAKSVSDGIEMWSQYCIMYNYTEEQKNVFYQMWLDCPDENFYLKNAIKDIYDTIASKSEEFYAKLLSKEIRAVGSDAFEMLFGKLWGEVKNSIYTSNPYVLAYVAGAKIGVTTSNALFNTDGQVTAFHNLGVMAQLRMVGEKTYKKYYDTYSQNKNEKNAKNYLASVDIMYKILNADCEYATKYVKSIKDTPIEYIKNAFGDKKIDNELKTLKNWSNRYDSDYCATLTAWIYELELDYPEQYELYKECTDFDYINKKYYIACPVDIYVYNTKKELVASVVGDDVTLKDDKLTLFVDDDRKTIAMAKGCEGYTFAYVGTDTGVMDINITEYSTNGKEAREVKFNEVCLNKGVRYSSEVSDDILTEDEYKIEDTNGNLIRPNSDTCNNSKLTKVSVIVENGLATDIDESSSQINCYENEYVTLNTYLDDDFLYWKIKTGSDDAKLINEKSATAILIPGSSDCVVIAVGKKSHAPIVILGQKINIKDSFDFTSLAESEKIAGYYIKDNKEKKLASVNNKGVVTPKKSGVIHITAYKKVGKQKVDVSTIELTIVVPTFDKKLMKATYAEQSVSGNLLLSDYEDASKDQTVIWKSSKTKVATVDEKTGLITAHKNGKTTISVKFTNSDGKSVIKKATFTVKIPKFNVKDYITLKNGKSKKLSISNTEKTDVITWSSSNNSVVSIEPNGKKAKIKALSTGSSEISAIVNGHCYKVVVTVP